MPPDPVTQVLTAYPQIYHACHIEHPRARTNVSRISAREGWILGHLDAERPTSPAELARHLSLGASTVSEALQRLERLGYVTRRKAAGDGRRIEVFLAPAGVAAMQNASVLDARPVGRLHRGRLHQEPDFPGDEQAVLFTDSHHAGVSRRSGAGAARATVTTWMGRVSFPECPSPHSVPPGTRSPSSRSRCCSTRSASGSSFRFSRRCCRRSPARG